MFNIHHLNNYDIIPIFYLCECYFYKNNDHIISQERLEFIKYIKLYLNILCESTKLYYFTLS